MRKVGVVGSRGYPSLARVVDFVRALSPDTIVVIGGDDDVDATAEEASLRRGLLVEVIQANWSEHGRSAVPIRNQKIVRRIDELAAFWDGRSPGTLGTILLATRSGKPVRILGPDGSERSAMT